MLYFTSAAVNCNTCPNSFNIQEAAAEHQPDSLITLGKRSRNDMHVTISSGKKPRALHLSTYSLRLCIAQCKVSCY